MSTSASHQRLGSKAGFAAAAFALAVAMLGTTLPTPLYGLYQRRFGFSELVVTVIFAAYAAGVIASLVLFGRLSDQIGRRRMLLPGLMLSALEPDGPLGSLRRSQALQGSARRLWPLRRYTSEGW